MKIVGKIDSPATESCDKCSKTFKRGEEIRITITHKDVLGWCGKHVSHINCDNVKR